MLSLLTERKRRLNVLSSTIAHPTTPIKLKLYALRTIGKMPYFRFRKSEHTDPNLAGYRPQFKAFNRELINTYITHERALLTWAETAKQSGELSTKDFYAVVCELARLPIPKIRMEDHCDDYVPPPPRQSRGHPHPTTQTTTLSAPADPNPEPNFDLANLDLTDLSEDALLQIVQNVQFGQNAPTTNHPSSAPTKANLPLAHC